MGELNITQRDRARDRSRLSRRIEDCQDLPFEPARPAKIRAPTDPAWEYCDGLPEINAANLDAATLRTAIAAEGALLVRGLLPVDVIPALCAAIDDVVEACAQAGPPIQSQPSCEYHDPPEILREVMKNGELGRTRAFHRDSGSAMCAEAPSVAETLLDLFKSLGLRALVEGFLGEPACLSVKKWVLRKTRLPVHEAGWHQDGAFMGADINSLNLWTPLTHCGGDTGVPGLDVIPRRLNEIVGAEGALFDWSVNPAQVEQRFRDTPPVSPVFAPGDALFFDHFFLHRTQYRAHFEHPRYAIETWFFGRHSAPRNQVPLTW